MKNPRNIARCLKFLSDARKGKHKAHGSDEFYVPDERPYTDEVLYVNSGTIPAKAYKGNLNIKKVIIGKDVKTIGAEAFSGCFYIESFVVEAENPHFADYNSNAIIEKKSGVLLVGCHTTVIPECVTEIVPFAFCGQTFLKKLTIPSSVKKIDAYAFDGCDELEELVFQGGMVPIGEHAFRLCDKLKTIHLHNLFEVIQ
jgi:hypothetical protein